MAYKGTVWISVLNDPHRDGLFTAVRGSGAFMNGKQIHVSGETYLSDAVVGLESPTGQESLSARHCFHDAADEDYSNAWFFCSFSPMGRQ